MNLALNPPLLARRTIPLAFAIGCLIASLCPGQTPSTGTITGRIFSPASGEYLRDAQIQIESTGQIFTSEDGGYYRISSVAPGSVTLLVKYTGYRTVKAEVQVETGATVTHDFELISTLNPTETIKLSEFTVSAEREGNAKAIMQQRKSMNITNSVSSDIFGDNAEGDVGEFLRNMPGVDLELTQGEVRNVRLRGLGAEYNAVTVDGVSLASADANAGAAGNARSVSMEQISLSSMDAIEVSKTTSADVDANAPAGTINLKTKRAFSREGRRITAQAYVTAFADEFNLRNSYGPDDARHQKVRPGGIFEYSDVFFNKRLGLVLNISELNLYSENARSTVTYNFTPTVADPRPIVPTTVALLHSPRLRRHSTGTLNADFKATSNLVLSLSLIYNYDALYNLQRTMTLGAGARASVVGANPLTSFVSDAAGTVTPLPSAVVKPGETYMVISRFEYKRGDLTIEGKFAGSESTSWYNPLAREGSLQRLGPVLSGVKFSAERSSIISADWKIKQLVGPDFGLGDSYTNPTPITVNDGRYSRALSYSGDIAATYNSRWLVPIVWKAGVKRSHEVRDFLIDTESKLYNYTGPGAGTGVWKDINSPYLFDIDAMGASEASSSGRTVFIPNLLTLGKLYKEHHEYFTQSLTTTNYYNAYVANTKHYEEDITAGFLMGTASIGHAIVRLGLRGERTDTDALQFNPRTPAEVKAAGYAETGGIATTIPGVQYQFFTLPKIHRKGSYDNLFPSGSFKYKFTPNFEFHFGYSSTIRRPTYRDITGLTIVDDDKLTVITPNPKLKPETSDNCSARLAYYFEPVGQLSLDLFQSTVQNLHLTSQQTAAQFGYTGPLDLSNYTFNTTVNSPTEVVIRGMEIAYSQSLSFLPRPFKGLGVRASYTRDYAQVVVPFMSPHSIKTGLTYSVGRFHVSGNMTWWADTPINVAQTLYNRHRAPVDVSGGVRLTHQFSLFFQGRNVANEPFITMQKVGANPAVAQIYEITGSIWTFGVKGVF